METQTIIVKNELKEKITLVIPVEEITVSVVVTPQGVTTTTTQSVAKFLSGKLQQYFIYKGIAGDRTNENLDRVVQYFTDAGTTPEAFINQYKIS